MSKINIHPSSVIFFAMLLLFDQQGIILPTLAAVILHEFGHLLPALLWRVPIYGITVWPFGADIRLGEMHGISAVIVTAGGCLCNLAAACIFSSCFPVFAAASLSLGLLNLVPVSLLDGGGLLWLVLDRLLLPDRVGNVMRIVSFISLIGLWVASVFLLLYTEGNISLFVMCVFLFLTLFWNVS